VLAPADYFSDEQHARELERVFLPGWHCVGAIDDALGSGDFVTRELFGHPILLRNEGGDLCAFLNVCAHRHCRLERAERGSARRIVCPYHGWEYDADGAVRKVPDAACFKPIRRGAERLHRYRVERLGRLVFVSLATNGPGLDATLGERTISLGREIFSDRFRMIAAREIDHPCNWKIPIENVLESYHVASLHRNALADHPRFFKVFTGAPKRGDEAPVHELGDRFTVFRDALGAESAAYRALMRRLRRDASLEYVHHHAFPNIVFGHTSIVSFLQVTYPTSPTTSHSTIRLFLHRGDDDRALLSLAISPVLDRVAGRLIDMVLREDAYIYPDAQRGLEASLLKGVLGSREERIHAFQSWLKRKTAGA
jgi:phenylpropionate dioxygenase-like ring-hydroxylating dioxygenase large terminal subunit